MRPLALILVTAALTTVSGCVSSDPAGVFRNATEAFARGDVEGGVHHFSQRLQAERSVNALRAYYADEERRRGVEFLLENHRFLLLEEESDRAMAQVTWTTGRSEPVYFIREDGRWKLDLGPGPEAVARSDAKTDPVP